MSDIFISYKREDQAIARKLANALEGEGWTVWWDPKLRAGEHFDDVIEKALNEAKCVIVLWSNLSVNSEYVKAEATEALEQNKLVPIKIESVNLPFRFKRVHTPSLLGWDGSENFSEFRRLVEDISTILGPSPTAVAAAEEQRCLKAEAQRKAQEERLREQERQRSEAEAKRKADDENRRRIEEERNREEQEVEQRRIEAEAQRKLEQERLREQEGQRAEKEAQRKADEESRKRIEEERNRAEREAQRRRLEAEAQRKAEEESLHEQQRQRYEEDARRKAEEAIRRPIHRAVPVPNPWRTYWPIVAPAAVALIIFSFVVWWPKPREAPVQEAESQKESMKEAPIAKPQPPKEIVVPATRGVIEALGDKPVLSAGKVFRDRLKNGQGGPEMVVIPAGRFRMGDVQGGGETEERPVRTVEIRKRLAVGRYEVTFEEYDQFAGATGRPLPHDGGWGRDRHPVINVSWKDAVEYTKWLSEQTGKRYRLHTEAEWEYAARGGTETAYWWGKDLVNGMANCSGCVSQWNHETAPVGSFKPNPFGLYDTAGNVWEWVEDCWHKDYSGAPKDGSAWKETDGGNCGQRVLRGGSLLHFPKALRSSDRSRGDAGTRIFYIGFRLAQDLD